jgi:LysM repeat protein
MMEATSEHQNEHQSEKQNNKQNELQENFLMWIIRYVMIPIALAGLAGFFAIAVVDRSFQHENGQSDDPAFAKIFSTMTAAAATAQPTPSLAPTLTVTAVSTQTTEPPAEESNTANKPPITSVPPQPGSPAVCPQVPSGWQLYTVQPGNTLFSLARETGTTVETIRQVNCLYGELLAYSQIWLPNVFVAKPEPTATNTPTEEPTVLRPTTTATATEPTLTPLPDVINDNDTNS